jgi:phospholipase/carboxylesterase
MMGIRGLDDRLKLSIRSLVANARSESSRPGMSRRRFVRSGLAAVAASMLPGCGPSPSTSTGPGGSNGSTGPRLTARPGSPTLTPTPGLSELGLGAPRDGFLYVPESYSEDTAAPLFIAFHGAGGAASNWGSYYERAEERGMVFLATDSRGSTWDLIFGGYGPDVAFLDEALEHTFERCRIDPARIAMGGFSDGASYALSLGVSNGDLLSHLIGYSPGFHSPSDPIVGKPRVFISHGIQDTILPVSISRDVIVPSFLDADYDVTYEEFAGGHEVPSEISESALDWFLGVV